MYINSAVIIPALNPMPELTDFVRKLLDNGIYQVIVVNDGSSSSFNAIFHEIELIDHCKVLTHEVNLGKGRALKTAFTYFLEHFSYLDGVVTADADGQHALEDILRLCEQLSKDSDSLILGVRNFNEGNVPGRSCLGNRITSFIFRLLFGRYLNDTQTGLRGIPAKELEWMANLKCERYDYEINMLIYACLRNIQFLALPIKTIYIDNNSSSHYSIFRDSVRILKCLVSGFIHYSFSPGFVNRFWLKDLNGGKYEKHNQ